MVIISPKKNQCIIRLLVVVSCLFFVSNSFTEGFLAGTLVRTTDTYKPIEELQVGDSVVNHNLKQSTTSTVAKIVYGYTSSFIKLRVNNEIIRVAPSHRFYLPREKRWVIAQDLTPGAELLSIATAPAYVTSVKLVKQPASVYTLSVRDYPTFFVSRQNVLVHNIPISIPFLAKFGFGAIEICWTKMGELFLGGLFCAVVDDMRYGARRRSYDKQLRKLEKMAAVKAQRKKGEESQNCEYHANCHGVHPNGIYENAPYHHMNSTGRKSPAPVDGQKALDYSVFVCMNENGKPRRIGLSYGQLVALDQTRPGFFHGHTRDWGGLTHDMRNALHREGWANFKTGKMSWPSWAK